MARTRDLTVHAIRREAFVDAAQRRISAVGYDRMSIQDVLDDVDASRGAFYHYFDSKAALLEAVIERMVDEGIGRLGPAIGDPMASALEKLEAFFAGIADYKAEQRDLILGFIQVWLSDDNSVVREHFRRSLVARLDPIMTAIVRQGALEGSFHVTSPEATARVLVSMLQGMNEDATGLFVGLDEGTIPFEQVEVRLAAYRQAMERILGAPAGSIRVPDPGIIRDWQRWQKDYRKDHLA